MDMITEEISDFVDKHVQLLVVTSKTLAGATEVSGMFLGAIATLTSHVRNFELALTKTQSIFDVEFCKALEHAKLPKEPGGKPTTDTMAKAGALKNPDFIKAREKHESLKADLRWFLGHIKIFDNASVLYRQSANGGS